MLIRQKPVFQGPDHGAPMERKMFSQKTEFLR